jgi:hypothetical protein
MCSGAFVKHQLLFSFTIFRKIIEEHKLIAVLASMRNQAVRRPWVILGFCATAVLKDRVA